MSSLGAPLQSIIKPLFFSLAFPSPVCNSNFVEAALGWSLEAAPPTVLQPPASSAHVSELLSSSSPRRLVTSYQSVCNDNKPEAETSGDSEVTTSDDQRGPSDDDSSQSDSSIRGRVSQESKNAARNRSGLGKQPSGGDSGRDGVKPSTRKRVLKQINGVCVSEHRAITHSSMFTPQRGGITSGDIEESSAYSDYGGGFEKESDCMDANFIGIGGLRRADLRE
jgi:hypothetical protein